MAQTSKPMLEGYRALDFSQVLAGPTTGRYMAEMGAEVVKVEFAPNGDISRATPYMRDGRSATMCNRTGARRVCAWTSGIRWQWRLSAN
jgi:crotonobetainyl-CoA:carnitine CoA-transferase CaiB-like acyl-CoA transferase